MFPPSMEGTGFKTSESNHCPSCLCHCGNRIQTFGLYNWQRSFNFGCLEPETLGSHKNWHGQWCNVAWSQVWKKMASEGTKKGSCVWICLKKCLLKHLSCSNDCISIHNKKPNFTSPVPFPQFRLTRTPSFFSNHGKNRGQKMPEITNSQSTSGPKGAPTVDLAKLPLLFKCSKRIITWIIAGTKMEHTHTHKRTSQGKFVHAKNQV